MPTPAARAIAHVRTRATLAREDAGDRAIAMLSNAGEPRSTLGALAALVRERSRITLNFHPDRLLADGHTVAEGLLRDGRYLSQFETGISNGSRTAFPGGERDDWERTLFGGAYHGEDTALDGRPKYGALDVMTHVDGGSPRFGSSYFVLRPHAQDRATFTWGDSYARPEHVGTMDALEPILVAMLDAAMARGSVLGVDSMNASALLHRIRGADTAIPRDVPPGRAIDDYIEAQIHGPIELATDVAALVVDPSFVGTPTGDVLAALCERHGMVLRHHGGFVLRADEVPSDFRGPRMVPLVHRIVDASGVLDAATLGRAAATLHREPNAWDDWGTREETLQQLKQLWHVLVAFGRPWASRA